MIFAQIKMVLKMITNKEQRLFYYLGLGAAFAILYQKGLFGQEGWLFMMVLLPRLLITLKNTGTRGSIFKNIIKQQYARVRESFSYNRWGLE
jgi:hypothetical protein